MREGYKIRGQYELVEVAGRGGMAVVWRATQHGAQGFTRTVAVKQMHEHLEDSRLYIDMFAEEARVGAALQSPNIAHVHDFIEEDGHYYLILEWIDGIDLGSFIRYWNGRGEPTPWELVAAVGVGMLRGLADAHERRTAAGELAPIVHRDVSPHNVLVTTRGMVKLIDFGLSLARDRTREVTEPGVVKGKMSYLSPEIVSGERPTEAADQFAVGSVLWEALVGRKLFEGESDFDVYTKLREGQVQPLRPQRKDLPRQLVSVIHRALSVSPEQRFPSAREMGKALGHVLKSHRSKTDLHALLGRTAAMASESLSLGQRTGEPSTTTPIAEPRIDTVEVPAVPPREQPPAVPVAPEKPDSESAGQRGLLHRLPFFGRRR